MDNKSIYQTLDGEELDLSGLNAEHRDLLKEFYEMYQKEFYAAFENTVISDEYKRRMGAKEWPNYDSKKYASRYYFDKDFTRTPIYRLLRDLLDRKGIEEGEIALDEDCKITDFSENKKVLEDFLK